MTRETGGRTPEKVKHIFRGIPADRWNESASSEENLETLRKDFERLGILIDSSVVVENSTLNNLVKLVNGTLRPTHKLDPLTEMLLSGVKMDERGQVIGQSLIESKEDKNFHISIGRNVVIGRDVLFSPNVSIGADSVISDLVHLLPNVTIGSACKVGRSVMIQDGCTVGDRTVIEDRTIVVRGLKIPTQSHVIWSNEDDQTGKVFSRVRQA